MKLLQIIILNFLLISALGCKDKEDEETKPKKPIIYLYPEEVTDVSIQFDGFENVDLTVTFPEYQNGWHVEAHPDGTLYDINTGNEFYALYWEGIDYLEFDFNTGFVVERTQSAAFLENALEKLGLTRREAVEFIIYWLPELEKSAFNFIHFSTDEWNTNVPLLIEPQPDTLIRIMMYYDPIAQPFEIEPQILTHPPREGFVVVEWGGTKL